MADKHLEYEPAKLNLDYETPTNDAPSAKMRVGMIALAFGLLPWLGTAALFMLPSVTGANAGRGSPVMCAVPISALVGVVAGVIAIANSARDAILGALAILFSGGWIVLFLWNFNPC
jgi:hypothetical protein